MPNPQIQTTRAITIHAPVAAVWPWVAQLGYHRGGWYTNARLDKLLWRIDNPSADHILPEFQHLEIGDTVPDGPEGLRASPSRRSRQVACSPCTIPMARTSRTRILVGRSYCTEIDAGSTRLILRTRATYPQRWWTTPLAYLALGPADFFMAHVLMLRGIKERAERTSAVNCQSRSSRLYDLSARGA